MTITSNIRGMWLDMIQMDRIQKSTGVALSPDRITGRDFADGCYLMNGLRGCDPREVDAVEIAVRAGVAGRRNGANEIAAWKKRKAADGIKCNCPGGNILPNLAHGAGCPAAL